MTNALLLLAARKINSVTDYARFFHTKSYLRQRSTLFRGVEANRRLMAGCGYRRYEKFARRRPEWDALGRNIPVSYLKAIGASLDVLEVAAEADLAEFHAALALRLSPKYAIERIMPAFYGNIAFRSGTSEAEALSILIAYSRKTGHQCCINFDGLKAVYVTPGGLVSPIYFPPTLRIRGGFLLPGTGGREIGTCSLGR